MNSKWHSFFALFYKQLLRSRRKRRILRWTLYPLFGLLILFFCFYCFFSTVGLPSYVTGKIAQELKERGFDFSAQNLKLSWNLNVQASKLGLSQDREGAVQFFLTDVLLNINYWDLLRGENMIDAVTIRSGYLFWPLGEGGEDVLRLVDISGTMVFDEAGENVWTLKNLSGRLLNMDIRIGGELKNADALRFKKSKPTDPESLRKMKQFVLRLLNCFQTFNVKVSPRLLLNLHLDAADWLHSNAEIIFDLEDVEGRYGRGDHLNVRLALDNDEQDAALRLLSLDASLKQVESPRLNVYLDQILLKGRLEFTATNMIPQSFSLVGDADWVSNQFCNMRGFHFDLNAQQCSQIDKDMRVELNVNTDGFVVENVGRAENSEFHTELVGNWDFEEGNLDLFQKERYEHFDLAKYYALLDHPDFPKQVGIRFRFSHPNNLWGKLDWLEADFAVQNRKPEEYAGWNTEDYGLWRWLIPLAVSGQMEMGAVNIPRLVVQASRLGVGFDWSAPRFDLKRLYSELYNGQLSLFANLNIENRLAVGNGDMTFNAHRIAHLLDPPGQRWINQFGWLDDEPPHVTAEARVNLAPWTNLRPDWKHEVLPSLKLRGHVQGSNADFKGVPVLTAEGDFCLTNGLWTLPEFKLTRPEGNAVFYYEGDSATQDYLWDFTSDCNPKDLGVILGEGASKALDMFEFNKPPHIEAKLWGRWKDLSRSGLDGTVSIDDFFFREQLLQHVYTHVTYTNSFVRAVDTVLKLPPTAPPVSDGETEVVSEPVAGQGATVDEVTYSNDSQQVTVSNAVCHLYPRLVTRMIGPVTDRAMKDYSFSEPPDVVVNGMIPVEESEHSYMDFKLVKNRGFRWWRLSPENLMGVVRWQGEQLCLTNLTADLYGGKLRGWAFFDFTSEQGSDFQFDAHFTDCDLNPFMNSLNNKSNKLKGLMDGRLVISKANTADWKSWNGYGDVSITNGLIWDIPVFGMFSDALNVLSPGLGNSQASKGYGTFTITNSVVHTEDLEIASPTFQMRCKGDIDFDRHLSAQIDMDILKEWGGFGRVVNFATTPLRRVFRCNVTGTFEKPEIEFVYIPKPLMMIVQPIKTVKGFLGVDRDKKMSEGEEEQTLPAEEPKEK